MEGDENKNATTKNLVTKRRREEKIKSRWKSSGKGKETRRQQKYSSRKRRGRTRADTKTKRNNTIRKRKDK